MGRRKKEGLEGRWKEEGRTGKKEDNKDCKEG